VSVRSSPTENLLFLVSFIDIVAIGITGIAWCTPRLAVDDLHVVRTTSDVIECTLDNLGGTQTVTLDAPLLTGVARTDPPFGSSGAASVGVPDDT
jgi:hypothetical protein